MNAHLFSEYAPDKCSDPTHVDGCVGAAGGDHELRSNPSRCWLCARVILLGNEDWRIVSGPKGEPVVICHRCVEHGDGQVEMTYEEQEGIE